MRVLLLSEINSTHTQKWAIALSLKGFQVAVFSFSNPENDWYSKYGIVLLSSSTIKRNTLDKSSLSKKELIEKRKEIGLVNIKEVF